MFKIPSSDEPPRYAKVNGIKPIEQGDSDVKSPATNNKVRLKGVIDVN